MLGETRFVEVDGHRLAYHRAGSGETVILVHGITTYSFIWQDVAPLLEDYDVIAIDLLGCGESDMPLDVSYAIQDHADRLYEFVQALGIEKFHLVGHDLGGGPPRSSRCASRDARHPHAHEQRRLRLLAGSAHHRDANPDRAPAAHGHLRSGHVPPRRAPRGVHNKELVTDALMAQFNMPLATSAGRQAFMHFARCLDNHNLTDIADGAPRADRAHAHHPRRRGPVPSAEIAEKLHAEIPDSTLPALPRRGAFRAARRAGRHGGGPHRLLPGAPWIAPRRCCSGSSRSRRPSESCKTRTSVSPIVPRTRCSWASSPRRSRLPRAASRFSGSAWSASRFSKTSPTARAARLARDRVVVIVVVLLGGARGHERGRDRAAVLDRRDARRRSSLLRRPRMRPVRHPRVGRFRAVRRSTRRSSIPVVSQVGEHSVFVFADDRPDERLTRPAHRASPPHRHDDRQDRHPRAARFARAGSTKT